MWRGELGEREAAEGRARQGAAFACRKRMETGDRVGEKHQPPKTSWRESGKVEITAGTDLKRETGERRGFKFR